MKKTLLLIVLSWLIQTNSIAQNLDSLWIVWQDKSKPDTSRLMALQIYSWDGYLYTQPDSAYYFAHLQYNFAKSKGLKKHVAGALNTIGTSYSLRGEYPLALKKYLECLKIKEELGDIQGVGGIYNSIGNVYRNQSNYPKALEYYFKSLKIAEELNIKYDIGMSLGNIGAIYADQSDYEKALEYYLKDLKISEEIGDEFGESITLSNIGALYDTKKEHATALSYYFKSLKIAEDIDDKQGIGITLGNIGNVYKAMLEYPKALEYYLRSLKMYEEIGDTQGIGIIHGNMGELFTKLGNYKEAEFHLTKGLKICQEIGASNFEKDYHSYLSVLYEKTNQPALALEHYKSYISLRDTIYSEENSKELIRTEMDHEFEKQQAVSQAEHKKEMEKQAALSEEKNRRQQIILYSVAAGFVLMLVFLLFIFRSNRQKQRANTIITLQKQEVENQKHLIEEKHKEITDSINYAERIQRSFLATTELLDENLNDYFVFFQPKDVVSGDFYWASSVKTSEANGENKEGNSFCFCCADSTGHGVPGAIMSILNISSLEKAIETATEPHLILNKTRELIIERLKKDGSPEGGKDGMDCSLLVLNHDKTQLSFASANNPVFIVRQTPPILPIGEEKGGVELLEFRPDKMPVGKHDKDKEPFTLQTISLQKGDVIYTLTDGFPDQFGGEKGKKYMIKNLKELFLSISHLPMKEQEELLDQEFKNWKGSNEQIDDVCIIGVRV